jgi:hypothetical protein
MDGKSFALQPLYGTGANMKPKQVSLEISGSGEWIIPPIYSCRCERRLEPCCQEVNAGSRCEVEGGILNVHFAPACLQRPLLTPARSPTGPVRAGHHDVLSSLLPLLPPSRAPGSPALHSCHHHHAHLSFSISDYWTHLDTITVITFPI